MRKLASIGLLAVALLLVSAAPSLAWSRGHFHGGPRVFVGVGPAFWWGPPYWWGPPVVYSPPVVIQQQPPVWVQQPQVAPPPPAATSAAPPEAFWYFCASAQDYYPKVPSCPEAWIKVPPRQE